MNFPQVLNEKMCPFCSIPVADIVVQTVNLVCIRDRYPVVPNHFLIIPRRHVESIFDFSPSEWAECHMLINRLKTLVSDADGFNIGTNIGEAGGQTVPHAHIHVIPRKLGDQSSPEGGIRKIFPEKAVYRNVLP